MYKKYALINSAQEIEDIPFSVSIIKYFPKKVIHKHILNKIPIDIKEISFFNKEGLEITLPIISSIFRVKDEEYIRTVIKKFNGKLLQYNINVLILSKELQKYKQFFDGIIAEGSEVELLYINKVVDNVIKTINKELKDLRFAIIDGLNTRTEYMIDSLYSKINHLTIITTKPEIFEKKIEQIYEETGLAVQLTSNNINQEIDSDIIINCNSERDKLFYCFKEGTYIIDFISDDEKIKDMMIKRSDINIITRSDIYVDGQLMSKDLLHGLLLYENRLLRSVYLYGYRSNMLRKIKETLEKNPITIGCLYQRNKLLIDIDDN